MAHPYQKHSENAVAHRRANKILTGSEYKRAEGGAVNIPTQDQLRDEMKSRMAGTHKETGSRVPMTSTPGRAAGGRVMKAGADSGVGRLEKAAHARKR